MARRDSGTSGKGPGGRDSDELEELAAEVDAVRPYLDLAREIRHAVDAFASDDAAQVESLVQALDAIPQRERADVARSVFDQLPVERQWAVLERVFGDEEIRTYLAEERVDRLRELRRSADAHSVVRAARGSGRLDLDTLPADMEVVLGLFRSQDVRGALQRGHDSHVCARQIVLRGTEVPGELQVLDDVFNPQRGFFVTAEYDEAVWRSERLASHSIVRIGSLVDEAGTVVLEPVLYPGARVDVEAEGRAVEGRLHLGFVLLGEEDVYATPT